MHEGNASSPRPGPGHLVHQAVAAAPAGLEGTVEIGYPVTDVMNAGSSSLEESGDGTVGVARSQQLDCAFPEREGNDCGAVGNLGWMGREPQDIPIERQGGFDIRHGDAHVSDAGLVGHDEQGNRNRGYHE